MTGHVFDQILSLEEASERSGLSASWLRHLVDDGRLPAKKVGKTWLVLEEDVEALSKQERQRGRPPRTLVVKSLRNQVGGVAAAGGPTRKMRVVRSKR